MCRYVFFALLTAFSSITYADRVDRLAQGCFSLQSTEKLYLTLTLDGRYQFKQSNVNHAGQFYFKATKFKHFLLSDQYQNLLDASLESVSEASKSTIWRISENLQNNLKNRSFKFDNGKTSFTAFLQVQQRCRPYPEISLNVSGDRGRLKGLIGSSVRGLVDAHTHITSYEFVGGKFVHGKAFHPLGVPHALGDCEHIHGPNGSLDLIGNIFSHNDPSARHATQGWPKFIYWPNNNEESHTDYYYRWIERAYLGGVRIMVSHLVESQLLCETQRNVNPASWVNTNSCNTMDSLRLQAKRSYQLQDYIDAQAGGVGKGFLRIVTSPQQARQVIANGQLAVILGAEASEVLDCGVNDDCTRTSLEKNLMELYQLGVRSLYPTHKFDNRLAGSRIEDGAMNAGQYKSTGHLFDTEECDQQTQGTVMSKGFPLVGETPVIGAIVNTLTGAPDYDQDIQHCNQLGLTDLGGYLVNRLIDLNMLIELDHTSAKSASDIMDIVESRRYSGVVSSHSWMTKAKHGGVHNNTKRMIRMGGFVAPYNRNAYRLKQEISAYLDVLEKTKFLAGVGIGTDMTGLATQARPREDVETKPLVYPFTSEFGLTFGIQKSGLKEFNYNQVGMAHYGMVADHLEEIRQRSGERIYQAVMNSAEAYIQMWERASEVTAPTPK
ncbi:MAG: microsomal dipeptidase-like Zn-dependent dipeptidase [Arenicella sp.]|jgi:microsomal dipeptidase-like Zn-dependent dipeptidase